MNYPLLLLSLLGVLFYTVNGAVTTTTLSHPLTVVGNNILNSAGKSVKLMCFNWAGHMDVLLPEGLNHQPVSEIVSKGKEMGFNCVRLTYATEMVTGKLKQTVEDIFKAEGLSDLLESIKTVNPWVMGKTPVEVFDVVIDELKKKSTKFVIDL